MHLENGREHDGVRSKKSPRRNGDLSECAMCHRYEPTPMLNVWVVREQRKLICPRCHPFFKVRFAEGRADAQAGIEQLQHWLEDNHLGGQSG